jgi:cellulose synthase/poly-beta-1,6-N-acetylglucosamine synthase-like glycosyltransferase
MPIRNEAAFIERSLGAVFAQDYPADLLEVLVVDGMSDDGTRDIVTQMLAGYPNARLLDNPQRIVPTALNIGLAEASGDVIVRIDGHAVVEPDYVSQCINALEETGADCVGGSIRTVSTTATAQAISEAMGSLFGVGDAHFRTTHAKSMWVDTLAFGAYRRQVFDRVGLFDEELVRNQDDEFNYRLRAAGGRIWLDPRIQSTYYARSTFRSLWRQYYQYGYWKVRVFQKVPGSAQLRHWVPPLFALAVVGGLLAAILLPVLRLPYLGGLFVYAMVNLAASALIAAREGWRHFLRLPIVFATLHLSYGLGFWGGVLGFGPPWRRVRPGVPPG